MTNNARSYREIYFTTHDGLRLCGRHYPAVFGSRGTARTPVLCLAGLSRNGRDFHVLAEALSQSFDGARDVFTLDYRGRGQSEFDKNWRNYAVPLEAVDVLDFMVVAGLERPAIIGTSRGGLIAMVMAALRPRAVGPVVLNDIGPVIEQKGLGRIAGYVGRIPVPASWPEAGALLEDMCRRAFPNVSKDEWIAVSRQWFNEHKGRPAPGYDPALANAMSVLDGPIPQLWPQFEGLKRVPVLVLRGENSDILSQNTVEAMHRRHPQLSSYIVPGEGHAPLLRDAQSIQVIAQFLVASEASEWQPRLAYG